MKKDLATALEGDYLVTYTKGSTQVTATLTDDSSGVGAFLVTVTLTETGFYSL
jgi:hypothetical protein